jgi:hypothetical protein
MSSREENSDRRVTATATDFHQQYRNDRLVSFSYIYSDMCYFMMHKLHTTTVCMNFTTNDVVHIINNN